MSIRRVHRVLGLLAFVLGLALALGSLLFPWIAIDLSPAAKVIVRKGHEVAPYAPLIASSIAMAGVVQSRLKGNRDISWISLFVAGAAILLFGAFVAEWMEQRDLGFMGLGDLPAKRFTLSWGYVMFMVAGALFCLAGYVEFATKGDPLRRRKRRHH